MAWSGPSGIEDCGDGTPALSPLAAKAKPEIEMYMFAQFEFFRQWESLKRHCQRCGIRIMGDIPIYVAHDIAEVWAHPELFQLDEYGKPTVVAGVPPDYFSATGQLWGNPIYRWDLLSRSGYRWWIDRFHASLKLFEMVRLDHFRGFEGVLGDSRRRAHRDAWKMDQGSGKSPLRGLAEGIEGTTDCR
jgi:4-alpha-glucanotransferase